ncbi:MAG: hypothetical protein JXR66_07410 [Bacteroidales bacterium]|nr:hypothetical protein [Bacteroidales bacterium]
MKTMKFKKSGQFFAEFALTVEQMRKVRGGDGDGSDPILIPPLPPVKI